jgi:hypothetical protein
MRKKLTKMIAGALLMTLIIPQSVLASSPVEKSSGTASLVSAQTTIGEVNVRAATLEEQRLVEEGKVSAIEVESIEDFIKSGTYDLTDNVTVQEIPIFSTMGESDISQKAILSIGGWGLYPAFINCQFTYSSILHPSMNYVFTSVSNIRTWATGIDVPLNISWTQLNTSHQFSNSNRNVTINASGYTTINVIFEGGLQILTFNQSYSFDYTARQ